MNDRQLKPLAKAIENLTAFLETHLNAVTKRDMKEMEERILKAFGERVDPKAVGKLVVASDALEQSIESNQSKLSGQ